MKFCFLDLETTGFDPQKDSIIECSFIIFENGKSKAVFDEVFLPDKSPLNPTVTQITGIKQEELESQNQRFEDFKSQISDLLQGTIIVGHNIDFDIGFLVQNGINIDREKRIDTHELARILLPSEESYALEVLSQKYGVSHDSAHRAMSDVKASKDFFDYLCAKISELPPAFLEIITPILNQKSNWYAKKLFLETSLQPQPSLDLGKNKVSENEEIYEGYDFEFEDTEFFSLGNFEENKTIWGKTLACLEQQKIKKVLITPHLSWYKHLKMIPLPEVIFDKNNFDHFVNRAETLSGDETVFVLKCLYRDFLGYRGKHYFDLFTYKELPLWRKVCMEETSDNFVNLLKERESFGSLCCDPYTYFRLSKHKIFDGRTLLIDEGEVFAEKLLKHSIKTFSLDKFLESQDEALAQKTQFFIMHFCQKILEPYLGRSLSVFPERMVFDQSKEVFDIENQVDGFLAGEEDWESWKKERKTEFLFWATYLPAKGGLSFSFWDKEDWEDLKTTIEQQKKIIGFRSNALSEDFLKTFLRVEKKAFKNAPLPHSPFKIPEDLISHRSPDYNIYCANKIKEIFDQSMGSMAINFSSLETLRSVYGSLREFFDGDRDKIFVCGEKVAGGDGKLLQMMNRNKDKRILFLYQKISDPSLQDFDWKTLVIQKFPFPSPHPVTQNMEKIFKEEGKSFWDLWVVPHLQAEITRRMALFSVQEIYFLDPRINSQWGRKVIVQEIY